MQTFYSVSSFSPHSLMRCILRREYCCRQYISHCFLFHMTFPLPCGTVAVTLACVADLRLGSGTAFLPPAIKHPHAVSSRTCLVICVPQGRPHRQCSQTTLSPPSITEVRKNPTSRQCSSSRGHTSPSLFRSSLCISNIAPVI